MGKQSPSVIVLAGPNGAGKSTAAPKLLEGALRVEEFVNADVIARGLSGFDPDSVAFEAGRIMLLRIRELARQRATFGFETTLASRSFANWIRELKRSGYKFHLAFLWLSSADEAIARVAARVRSGGHDVPVETIRRRYGRGLKNLFALYQPIATTWQVLDNSRASLPRLIAAGRGRRVTQLPNPKAWRSITSAYAKEK